MERRERQEIIKKRMLRMIWRGGKTSWNWTGRKKKVKLLKGGKEKNEGDRCWWAGGTFFFFRLTIMAPPSIAFFFFSVVLHFWHFFSFMLYSSFLSSFYSTIISPLCSSFSPLQYPTCLSSHSFPLPLIKSKLNSGCYWTEERSLQVSQRKLKETNYRLQFHIQ